MVFVEIELSKSYWDGLEIEQSDIDFIYAYLLEKGKPLTSFDLAGAMIKERIRSEQEQLKNKQSKNGIIYLPKLQYKPGEKIQFPAFNWLSGQIDSVREGKNPEYPELQVITVSLENGKTKQFASNIEEHKLNQEINTKDDSESFNEQDILTEYGELILQKLEKNLQENKDIVRIGDKWFPKSLLIDFNIGHLNLAEAVLDMNSGGPLTADALLDQIEINTDDPKELVEFSFNYALDQDPRFDEVGPSGAVQWFLNRLEPEFVREKPLELKFSPIEYDRSILADDVLKAEQRIDDELIDYDLDYTKKITKNEVSVVLNYPHWRSGSIPLTVYTQPFFPTALESPRVKFKFVDADKREISAWVVRPYKYIYGLREWYEEHELMPGSIIKLKQGKTKGEVYIEPQKKRSNREWVKTLLIGTDGGVVFAMLKQTITADFNERMAIAIPAVESLDALWKEHATRSTPLKKVVINTMIELAKLNPQSHVHSIELYSALNCIRRCPPGLLFSILASNPEFSAVGDLYFRLSDNS